MEEPSIVKKKNKFIKIIKKQSKVIVMILVSVLVIAIGSSYALLRNSQVGTNAYTINAGNLEVIIKDEETESLTISNMYPMTDEEGLSQTDELTFVVKNTGDIPALYDVYIEETSTNPAFKTVIRYVDKKNDGEYSNIKVLSDNKYIDQSSFINVDEEVTYKVKLWLAEEADITYMNKTFTAKIIVEASQIAPTEFDYTGTEATFTASASGTYLLEVWGAQGGNATYDNTTYQGGYGGYSKGYISLTEGEILYINVGGQGQSSTADASSNSSDTNIGYNGGGYASAAIDNSSHGGGGGATHISTTSGLLSSLSGSTSDILIVSGGGGGASSHKYTPSYSGNGGSGGGYIGGEGVPYSASCYSNGLGATQATVGGHQACSTDGHAYESHPSNDVGANAAGFGLGGNYTRFSTIDTVYYTDAGGGGGYYGGGAGWHAPGGGGSGYIGNILLFDKHMTCYNCQTSDSNMIRTISNTCHSEIPTADCSKEGNGFVKITYINSNIVEGVEYTLKSDTITFTGSSDALSGYKAINGTIASSEGVTVTYNSSGNVTCSISGTNISCEATSVAPTYVASIADCQVALGNSDVVLYGGQCYYRAGHSPTGSSGWGTKDHACGSASAPLYNNYNKSGYNENHCPGNGTSKAGTRYTSQYCNYAGEGCLTAGWYTSGSNWLCKCYAPSGRNAYYRVTISYSYYVYE